MKRALLAILLLCAACSQEQPKSTPIVDPKAAEISQAFAGLSEQDRKAAEKQWGCPVSGKQLGTMGTPIKVSTEGLDVYLCCEQCRPAFNKDPQKYIADMAEE